MSSEEKAKELVEKFFKMGDVYPVTTHGHAKRCALIAVDEMLFEVGYMSAMATQPIEIEFSNDRVGYLRSVKSAIEKL